MTSTLLPPVRARADRRDMTFGVFGCLLGVLSLTVLARASGTASYAFSLPNAAVDLPLLTLPVTGTVSLLGVVSIALGAWQAWRGTGGRGVGVLGLSVLVFLLAFLTWSATDTTVNIVAMLRAAIKASAPLTLGALAGVMCEKSGIINIAIEGQLLVGAMVAAAVGSVAGPWVGLPAAVLGAVLFGLLLAVFTIRYKADQIIVGVVLVVLASGLTAFLVRQLPSTLNQPVRFKAVQMPLLSDIPVLGPLLFSQTVIVYLMFAGVAVCTWVLFQTRWGLRLRAVGEKPSAADTVGVAVHRIRYQAVAFGSIFAGIGGAFYTLDSSGQFSRDMTNGAGFIALAAVLVGRYHPVGAFSAALLFGFADALATQLSIAGVPIDSNILGTAPYVVTILVVAGVVGRVRVPAAGGQPYTPG
jgi:ABC-type uncharacterized transport system permease subunit